MIFLFGISGGEVFIVILVILVLFGADRIPELARTFGKGMNEFKKAADDIKREIQEGASAIKDENVSLDSDVSDTFDDTGDAFRSTGYETYQKASQSQAGEDAVIDDDGHSKESVQKPKRNKRRKDLT